MDESGQLDPTVDPRLEQVLSDYSRRVAAGEPIGPSDLISQNPSVADALRSYFAIAGGEKVETSLDQGGLSSGTQYIRPSSQATIPPRNPAAAAELPERFGRYRIERCLGRGAMGDVYLAQDTQLDRPVALKIPRFTDDSDSELIERFYREARAAATVRHPNLCPVHDAGEIDGVHYLSMTYIEGRPLYDVLAENGCPSQRDAVAIVLKLAKALDAAHSSGVIHRDLKPANIMIDAHQEPILMDFGLARRTNKDDSRLTQSGLVMGSPAYMSPEQVEADIEKIGPACDIYSLGIIFYELLTGTVPFRGSIASVMGQIITVAPRRPSALKPNVEPTLEAICLKMIAKRPEDRFGSMREVAAALDAYLSGRPTGVTVADRDPAASGPPTAIDRHSHRGILIAPWMLWTAVAVVVAGFGVTWQLIALMMKQQSGVREFVMDAKTRDAVARGDAQFWLNDKQLKPEQLSAPLELPVGNDVVQVREGDVVKGTQSVVSDEDDPKILEKTKDGKFPITPLHQRVAEWVLSQGGKIKLVGSDAAIAAVQDLPKGKLQIAEIDLAAIPSIPVDEMGLIEKLTKHLKRLVLPKTGVSQRQLDELRKALPPDCEIKKPE
jgi:predicted Ser/Thr protein kinase